MEITQLIITDLWVVGQNYQVSASDNDTNIKKKKKTVSAYKILMPFWNKESGIEA